MTLQLVLSSSLFDTVGVAAAVDAGLLGTPDQRILLQSKGSVAPELVLAPAAVPGADRVLAVFDRVITLNDLVGPLHPLTFSPLAGRDRVGQALVLQRLLRRYWQLGDEPVELVLESLAANPAQWLAAVFHDSPITIISDGLMSYGPTRNPLPVEVGHRVDALVHVDLVPGVRPVLLHELGVPSRAIPTESVIKVFADLADGIADQAPGGSSLAELDDDTPTGLVLGQYLADLGLITRAEEGELQAGLVRAAVDAGAERILFKPHPSSPPGSIEPVRQAARAAGVELRVITERAPAEVLIARLAPTVVAASFSTALVTARTLYDCRIVSAGTELLLRRLRPYPNSNRIPVTLVDALTRPDSPYRTTWELQTLVDAVAHAMQPQLLGDLRHSAEAFWASHPVAERTRYGPPPIPARLVRSATRQGLQAMATSRAFSSVERVSRGSTATRTARRVLVRLARI